MKERLISSLIMLPLLILLVLKGLPLYIGGVLLMIIALHEFYLAFEAIDYKPIKTIGYIYAVFLLLSNAFGWKISIVASFLFALFIISTFFVLNNKNTPIDICITFAGIGYICIFLEYIILIIDTIPNGDKYVWLVFLISFSTDIFAYFIGRQFGRRKLLPLISPKKTIEGSIGGMVSCLILTIIFGLIFKIPLFISIILGLIGSIIAQLGDLTASSIKRYVGIKDFGRIIPGHGGVLDRFDSVILVAPFVYFVFDIFIRYFI